MRAAPIDLGGSSRARIAISAAVGLLLLSGVVFGLSEVLHRSDDDRHRAGPMRASTAIRCVEGDHCSGGRPPGEVPPPT